MPMVGWPEKHFYPGNAIIDLKNACEEIGRDYSKITMTSMDPSLELDELIGDFEAGYQHFIYFVSTQSLVEMSEKLDSIFKLIDDSRSYFQAKYFYFWGIKLMGRNGMPDKKEGGGRPACHLSLLIIIQI